ncbi:MAG: glycosyltransferase family 4 protein [Chloroflexota bacterium]
MIDPGTSPRLRIAFVYDALIPYCSGGAERRFHELAIRLAERHDVHHVTWRFWGDEPTIVRDGVTLHGIGAPRGFYGSDGKRTIREAVEFAARLPSVLARLGADVVDASATPFLPLYAAWATTRATRTPLVATWHEFWGDHWLDYLPDRPVVARAARFVEGGARRVADRRIAVSPFTARRMAGRDADGPGIEVVANGVDLAAMSVATVDDQRSDLIYVGRLIDEKRVDLLIRAVAGLVGRFPELRCVIVGDGPERAALGSLAVELGVDEQVTFVGRVSDERVPSLMRASRVLVLPSEREGYGITVVEGQACGLVPVVAASPMSAAPDLISDGVDGLVFDPSPTGLTSVLADLLADARSLKRIARAARATAEGRGWDSRALEMERVYIDLVAERRLAGPKSSRAIMRRARLAGPAAVAGAAELRSEIASDHAALLGEPRW